MALTDAIRKATKVSQQTWDREAAAHAKARERIARHDDFYLRVRTVGYDWGTKRDPDNILPNR